VTESDLAFLLHHLESQNHISSFVFHLALELDLRAVTQNKQRCAGESCGNQNKGRQQFGAELQDAAFPA
jgi:hypothetical protein